MQIIQGFAILWTPSTLARVWHWFVLLLGGLFLFFLIFSSLLICLRVFKLRGLWSILCLWLILWGGVGIHGVLLRMELRDFLTTCTYFFSAFIFVTWLLSTILSIIDDWIMNAVLNTVTVLQLHYIWLSLIFHDLIINLRIITIGIIVRFLDLIKTRSVLFEFIDLSLIICNLCY